MNGSGPPAFVEVGTGLLDWPAILAACRESEVEWGFIEQDVCPSDPFDSLARSLGNLRALGLE